MVLEVLVTRRPDAYLSARELEVVDRLARGRTTKEIGHELDISIWTVHAHIANARRRTNSRTTAQLIARYRRRAARSN